MVSFNDNGSAWLHDSNEERCSFYGNAGGASIEVVSNQDPSAIKMFKSLSLETNGSGWSGKVFTNDEYSGVEKQEGDILASFFQSKEGFKYAEIPRSKINSSDINTVASVGSYEPQSLNVQTESFPYTIIYFDILQQLSGLSVNDDGDVVFLDVFDNETLIENIEITIPAISLDGSLQINRDVYYIRPGGDIQQLEGFKFAGKGEGFVKLSYAVSDFDYTGAGGAYDPSSVAQVIYNALFTMVIDDVDGNNVDDIIIQGDATLFIFNESEIEGDQMRGPYARVMLETQTTEPFELHAINVDYEFSKLDKRLTQNS
tara:strand:- start:440 stop:1384 length:945 start_codon:yes stop_codon:yes gene_type:complete